MCKVGIAIDIGTTNIVIELVDITNKAGIYQSCEPNVNLLYGKDVMSRITHAQKGKLSLMTMDLRRQLNSMIEKALAEANVNEVDRVVIACNTLMTHILLGESCYNLGVYPFSPVHTHMTKLSTRDIDITSCVSDIVILPGYSAYVGGDIYAGIEHIGLHNCKNNALFIDLGTNSEMVCWDNNKKKMYITSAAAGPAFEMAGYGQASELVDLLAEARTAEVMDETGLLSDEYFETGYKTLTEKKIRLLQSAKAAVRAGMEILLKRANFDYSDIAKVYIAGAFGNNLNIESAIKIGLIPSWWADRIVLAGNTALLGAVKILCEPDTWQTHDDVHNECEVSEILLANEEEFEQLYLDSMYL